METLKFIAISMLMMLFTLGCKEKKTIDDILVYGSRDEIINNPKYPEDAKQLAEQAIQLWDNDRVDEEPVLIFAAISSVEGREDKSLTVIYYDENKDLLGIIIEEYSHIDNENTILIEKYPIFNYDSFLYVTDYVGPPKIILRQDGMLKDEKQWEFFLTPEASHMPPVIISLPSEKIDVYINLYDRQGNKSNKVKLIDFSNYHKDVRTE